MAVRQTPACTCSTASSFLMASCTREVQLCHPACKLNRAAAWPGVAEHLTAYVGHCGKQVFRSQGIAMQQVADLENL